MPLIQPNIFYINRVPIHFGSAFAINGVGVDGYVRTGFAGVKYDNVDTQYIRNGLLYCFDVLDQNSFDQRKPIFSNVGSGGRSNDGIFGNDTLYSFDYNGVFLDGADNFFAYTSSGLPSSKEITISVTFNSIDPTPRKSDIISVTHFYDGTTTVNTIPFSFYTNGGFGKVYYFWQMPASSSGAAGSPGQLYTSNPIGVLSDKWNNTTLVLSKDGVYNIYLNGDNIQSTSIPGWNNNWTWHAKIDGIFLQKLMGTQQCYYSNFMVYDRALSSAEVQFNYDQISINYPLG